MPDTAYLLLEAWGSLHAPDFQKGCRRVAVGECWGYLTFLALCPKPSNGLEARGFPLFKTQAFDSPNHPRAKQLDNFGRCWTPCWAPGACGVTSRRSCLRRCIIWRSAMWWWAGWCSLATRPGKDPQALGVRNSTLPQPKTGQAREASKSDGPKRKLLDKFQQFLFPFLGRGSPFKSPTKRAGALFLRWGEGRPGMSSQNGPFSAKWRFRLDTDGVE